MVLEYSAWRDSHQRASQQHMHVWDDPWPHNHHLCVCVCACVPTLPPVNMFMHADSRAGVAAVRKLALAVEEQQTDGFLVKMERLPMGITAGLGQRQGRQRGEHHAGLLTSTQAGWIEVVGHLWWCTSCTQATLMGWHHLTMKAGDRDGAGAGSSWGTPEVSTSSASS